MNNEFFKTRTLKKQETYKKVVRVYLLYSANITYKEMAKLTNLSEYTVCAAINHYFNNKEFYKEEINSDLYFKPNCITKNKNTVEECFVPDKLTVGINTMQFWYNVSIYKRKLFGNVTGEKMTEYDIEKLINYTLKKTKKN